MSLPQIGLMRALFRVAARHLERGPAVALQSYVPTVVWHDVAVGGVHGDPRAAREGVGHVLHGGRAVAA
eukprot:4816500-Pyramimonas_sp.AAC.1